MRLPVVVSVVTALVTRVSGHGNMVYPYVWMDTDEEGRWHAQPGGGLGCGSISGPHGADTESHKIGCIANWFTNNTLIFPTISRPLGMRQEQHPSSAPAAMPGGTLKVVPDRKMRNLGIVAEDSVVDILLAKTQKNTRGLTHR